MFSFNLMRVNTKYLTVISFAPNVFIKSKTIEFATAKSRVKSLITPAF